MKTDYAEAYSNLGMLLYSNGNKHSALENIEKANDLDQRSKKFKLLLDLRVIGQPFFL